MNGFDIIALGPKSGLHLSGDILLFIENVRVPFIVGRGRKTLVDEMFLWVEYRSHSTGRELILTVAGQRVCAGILHSLCACGIVLVSFKACVLRSLFFMGLYTSFITEINVPFRTSLRISKLSCLEVNISSV